MEKLINGVRSGEREAFAQLHGRYRPLILSQVSRFSGDSQADREELMQEAALALYRAALRYEEGEVTFGAYARVCIANALISLLRKAQVGHYSLDEMKERGTLSRYIEPGDEDLSNRLIENEEAADLHKRAKALLSPYEAVVFEYYMKGYSPQQIAKALGREEKSVANAVSRMQSKLRSLFG